MEIGGGICWPSRTRNDQIEKALAEVDVLHLKDEPIGHLSGGEQQRLLIAQALISKPANAVARRAIL